MYELNVSIFSEATTDFTAIAGIHQLSSYIYTPQKKIFYLQYLMQLISELNTVLPSKYLVRAKFTFTPATKGLLQAFFLVWALRLIYLNFSSLIFCINFFLPISTNK